MERLDGALEGIFPSTNGWKGDSTTLASAAPGQEYGPQLPIRPIDESSRGNFHIPVSTAAGKGPHGLPRRALANGRSPSGDGDPEEALPLIDGTATFGQGPSSGLSGSMEATQQEDFKKFRFWKGSAGSLRHRSSADIPNVRYRQEPMSPAGRAEISQHNAAVASSSQQQGTSSSYWNGPSTRPNITSMDTATYAYGSDAPASNIPHQVHKVSALNASDFAAESEECNEGPTSNEGQSIDRLLLQLPLENSMRDSEDSLGTPGPLADVRRLDESASLRSVGQFSGEDDASASMRRNVPSEDSNSARSSYVEDGEAESEWDTESSTSSNGPCEDALTSGENGARGISESLLTLQNAQADADAFIGEPGRKAAVGYYPPSMEEQESDSSDDDSRYSTAGKQSAIKDIHAAHRGGEAGSQAPSRPGFMDAGNGSGSDISEDELFDYYTTVEERMQRFNALLYGDQDDEEQNANPVPVFQEGGEAAGQQQARRPLISPERLWRHHHNELRHSAIQRFKVRNAQSLLAQHRAGANVHGKELIGSAPLLRPTVQEVKRQAVHPHRLPAMSTKISNQVEQINLQDLIPPARLRQAAKIQDKVAALPSWKLAGTSLESYDLKAALGSVENQDMPVFKSMPQLGSHGYGNDIAASRYAPGQQEFHRNVPSENSEDNHFPQRAPRVGFKQVPLTGSQLPGNEITGNDGQDIGPWSTRSSARRSGRGASGAPSPVLAPLPKDTKIPRREVKQGKQKDKQSIQGKADDDEDAAMGWLETHDLIPNISLDDEGLDLQAIATYGISGRDSDGNVREDELQRNSEFHGSLSPTTGFSKDSFKLKVPLPPPPTTNIIPSRSKIFDSSEGFDAGHRQKPEIHNAMSASQLQEVLCQYFVQAARDVRSMNIATESSGIVLSPARREAQRHMAGNFGGSKSGAWSIAELLGGGKGSWRSEACSPQEMLLQIVLSGRVTQEVLISTLQRQSRDVQDATIKLFVNFTARCAPQNRCQVAAVCAVADMTAFANLLVTSKLEVAEQMLLHLPATHDEANLLSCKLALDWGKKNIGNIHPNVEEVLKLVHRCMSKVGDRMDDQKDRLHQMRIRRGNAAALYQASQRVMLGAMSGMFELEYQVSELVMNMVACSKFFLVGYNAIEKALYIRGKREAMDHSSAMVTAILDRVPLNISTLADERVTEYDLKRIMRCYKMGLKVRNMLIVPVFHKRGTDRPRCVGLMVALNKKTKGITSEERKGHHLSAFQDADKTVLRKAGAILAPAVIAAMRHTEVSISQRTIAARHDKAQRFIAFSSAVHQSLDPSEIWGSIMEEAPAIFNCARVVLYMYVENGIVAVQNAEGEMLEFLTIEEAGIAGEMFNSRAPRYLSTRTHAMNKKQEDMSDAPIDVGASSSPKRVTIQDPEAGASSSGLMIHESAEGPATATDSTPGAMSQLISAKRPESRDSFWNPQYSNESLSKCLMPEPSIPVYSLLLAPLRQRVSIEEAKKLRAHLKRKVVTEVADDSDDDSDDDDEYADEGKDMEVTWAVLVAMNKELTREQEEENMLAREIGKIQAAKASEAAGNKQSWRAKARGGRGNATSITQEIYPEFSNTDEATVEAIGRVVYPAMVNAQVQPILQQHLSNLLG